MIKIESVLKQMVAIVISILYCSERCALGVWAQAFLNAGSSVIPSDAHVCRQPRKKPLDSTFKYSDPTAADASFH